MSSFQNRSMWRYLQLLFFILISRPVCLAQDNSESSIRFHHITPDESFGVGSTWAILEDHEGFIWFGTEDGLLKYDGYQLTSYRQSNTGSNSLIGNIIVCLFEDSHHNLWIGSFGAGLNLYVRSENKFYNFNHDPDNPNSLPFDGVKTILEDSNGILWFGTEGGGIATLPVNEVNQNLPNLKFNVIQHDPNNPNSLGANSIRSLTQDKKGNIYVGTYGNGLNIIDSTRKNFTRLPHDDANANSPGGNIIFEVFVDSKERVWIGTHNAGLDLYLPEEKRFIHYPASSSPTTLHHNEVETITEDESGTIWVGTDNGLSRMLDAHSPVPENKFETFHHEPQYGSGILSNSIKIAYVDSHNTLWVGSYYGGINVYNKNHFKFQPIRNKPWKKNSLSGNNVTSFAEDQHGNVWIGTDGGGLNLLPNAFENILKDQYKVIELINPFTKKIQLKIKSLALDTSGNLWVGTWGSGMFRYNTVNGSYKYFGQDDDDPSFEGYSVLTMKVDKDNNLWAGTLTNGLTFYNQKKNSFYTYRVEAGSRHNLTATRINSIFIDSKDRVWIGGDIGGLNLYNKTDDTFTQIRYETILTDKVSILSLTESKDGKIWIGTISGVVVYDPEQKTAVSYSEQNGLPDNVIHAMLEDDEGRIWMSTNRGIVVFDEELGAVSDFNKGDGLQGNQFNHNSAYRSRNGLMFFGGTNGWNAFYPKEIQKIDEQLPIAFTKFWVNGELVDLNSPASPLTAPLNSSQTINLLHDQNSFALEFASLEFNFSDESNYAYILEGFNDKWQYLENDRKVSFTNLFPRTYTLKIRATNKDGFWSERAQPLKIIIHPAWWQTIWFKIGTLALLGALIFIAHKIRIRLLVSQRNKLETLVNERTVELRDSNQMLKSKIEEINSINVLLNKQRNEIIEKNNEILSQNEELSSQNEQIVLQQQSLLTAQDRLKEINEKLEKLVDERTAELQSTIKKLNKTVNELDRFVYSASHDLSAPLKSVRGLVQLAEMEKEQKQVKEYYQYINQSILKLEVVIGSLAEYSRNAHLDPKIERFNLYGLVNEVLQEVAFWPEASKINYRINVGREQVVQSDKSRLKVVLHNLISNGIKYADLMKEESLINITYRENGKYWEFKIEDNGIGIDAAHIDKIFDMYFRATDKSKGSGLGLFIVKEILNRLGGDIKVDSTKGLNTCFTIWLPKENPVV